MASSHPTPADSRPKSSIGGWLVLLLSTAFVAWLLWAWSMMGEGTNTLPHSAHGAGHGDAKGHADDHSHSAPTAAEAAVAPPAQESPATSAFTITTPVAGSVANLPMGAFTFSGTGSAGGKVILFGDGAEMASAPVAADGTWALPVTFTPPTPAAMQLRLFGADGVQLSSQDVQFEFIAPATAANPADAKFALLRPVDQGSVAVGEWVIAGTGKPGTKIKLQMDKYVLGEANVAEDGTWRFPRTIQKAGDARVLTALVVDGAPEEQAKHTIKVLP